MTQPIALLFGVHAHQPVGNFPSVMDDAHLRSYGPFLRTVYEFPNFKFAIHFSGWLLDYLLTHFPDDMRLLREMVVRGQAELVGAGDTEPVLAVIPERDRIGQLLRLSDRLEAAFGARPRGAWLTERVWEATVVPALAEAGIEYVMVDDYHFLCAGKSADDLGSYFTTDENDRSIDLFPISEALRYRFPFAPVADAIGYLEQRAAHGDRAAIYFDDIEKFGIWPHTYEWVFEKGWLRDFLRAVEASPLVNAMHFSAFRSAHRTSGVIYLPTTSYIEMNEWTLPLEAAERYARLVDVQKANGEYAGNKAFLRGGIWKNFFNRYDESNWMHKRMCALSRRLGALEASQRSAEMFDALYRAQANDAYWHGLFGGLYLPHLRRAVYAAMIELEALLDNIAPRNAIEISDPDLDGNDEIFIHATDIQAIIRCDRWAAVHELDSYACRHNFGDTLARRAEHYHRRIDQTPAATHAPEHGIASAHDMVAFRHAVTRADLVVDEAPRRLFVDRWRDGARRTLAYRYASAARFHSTHDDIIVVKEYLVDANALRVRYRFDTKPVGTFSTELNLAMPSCDGPAGRYIYQNEVPGGFGQPLAIDNLRELKLEDDILGGAIVLTSNLPLTLDARPLHTVSQSEAGFEKIMQAVVLTLEWNAAQLSAPLEVGLTIEKYQ